MRFRLISCDIFFREMSLLASRCAHRIDLTFLPKGLHDLGAKSMLQRVQQVVDEVPRDTYDAILLGYGLCNNGLDGLVAKHTQLVLPRAHDCIALFMGGRDAYRKYFDAHPGAYYLTTGWMERADDKDELQQLSIQHQTGMDATREELAAQYGEDNAEYLAEILGSCRHYGQFTFIEMGVEPNDSFEQDARARAEEKNWSFDKVQGSLCLLEKLLSGSWPEADFLTVSPGYRIKACYDDAHVVTAISPTDSTS